MRGTLRSGEMLLSNVMYYRLHMGDGTTAGTFLSHPYAWAALYQNTGFAFVRYRSEMCLRVTLATCSTQGVKCGRKRIWFMKY